MNEFTEVTADNLKFIRGSKSMNQEELAAVLGLPRNAISKIENGDRSLTTSEKALLDLYFFGTIPFEIANEKTLRGVLDFTPEQWRVIEILARRASMTPGKWIATQIRAYLAYDAAAREISDQGNSTGTDG
ncbi:MAG: helix-turn-helix domain-containing protein [Verrucomicrobiae bacterium]|nr:helix-turn-helix domain-containing protein [Verrucomicrobiae bacterium]